MAIRYIQLPEKKMTIAILENTRYSAVSKIAKAIGNTKSLCFDPDRYVMPNSFKAIAKCSPEDQWDADVGKVVAKAKVMRKYYKSYDKMLDMFSKDIMNLLEGVDNFF